MNNKQYNKMQDFFDRMFYENNNCPIGNNMVMGNLRSKTKYMPNRNTVNNICYHFNIWNSLILNKKLNDSQFPEKYINEYREEYAKEYEIFKDNLKIQLHNYNKLTKEEKDFIDYHSEYKTMVISLKEINND